MIEMIGVTGQPRCGSTLVMTMLAAAGVPTIGEAPSYEKEVRPVPPYGKYDGHAMKFLDLQYVPASPFIKYRWIRLRRNPHEQAMSQIKFARWQRAKFVDDDRTFRIIKNSIKECEPLITEILKDLEGEVLNITFEDLIINPEKQVWRIGDFLGIDESKYDLMVKCVVSRTPKCLPGMLEETLIPVVKSGDSD